jgi:hypothetical protein
MEAHRPSRAVAACAEFPNDNPALHRGAIWCCVELGAGAICEPAAEMHDVVACVVTEPTPTEPIVLALQAPTPAGIAAPSDVGDVEPPAEAEPGVSNDESIVGGGPDNEEAHDSDSEDEAEIEIVDDLVFDDAMLEGPVEDLAPREEAATPDDPFATLVRVVDEVARAAGCGEETVQCVRALLGATRLDADALPGAIGEGLIAAGVLERTEGRLVRAEAFARQVAGWQGVLRGESEDFGACGAAMLDEWCANVIARAMGNASRAEGLRRELRRRGVAAFGLVADAA